MHGAPFFNQGACGRSVVVRHGRAGNELQQVSRLHVAQRDTPRQHVRRLADRPHHVVGPGRAVAAWSTATRARHRRSTRDSGRTSNHGDFHLGQILVADDAKGPWRSAQLEAQQGLTFTRTLFAGDGVVVGVGVIPNIRLGEQIGLGTILNVLLIGTTIDPEVHAALESREGAKTALAEGLALRSGQATPSSISSKRRPWASSSICSARSKRHTTLPSKSRCTSSSDS